MFLPTVLSIMGTWSDPWSPPSPAMLAAVWKAVYGPGTEWGVAIPWRAAYLDAIHFLVSATTLSMLPPFMLCVV